MSTHSYSRVWLHMIWATKERRPLLRGDAQIQLAQHFHTNAGEKEIYLQINHVNEDHVHVLIDLPTNLSIEAAVKLFKGESSHWINQNRITSGPFAWQSGYGVFSVSHSRLDPVCRYISNQKKHHQKRSFDDELRELVKSYGLVWHAEGL